MVDHFQLKRTQTCSHKRMPSTFISCLIFSQFSPVISFLICIHCVDENSVDPDHLAAGIYIDFKKGV